MISLPKKKKELRNVFKYLGNSIHCRHCKYPSFSHTYTLAHALTQKACVWVLVWAWAWTRLGLRLASRCRFVFARAEVLLYDQFRRNVSSAVAARFIVVDVFATHLNLDFTEFNFAVRMTPLACIGVPVLVCVCEFIFFM